uniref:Uncharacterized protein n=1 Tax=Anopheles coluzzii TaxID=1518534 RepID=A0A8W7Q0Y4_ANOCL
MICPPQLCKLSAMKAATPAGLRSSSRCTSSAYSWPRSAAADSLGVRYLLVERDHLVPAGVLAGEPQRQIVRLRAGVDEVADGQVAGHLCRERLGALNELVVQEAVTTPPDLTKPGWGTQLDNQKDGARKSALQISLPPRAVTRPISHGVLRRGATSDPRSCVPSNRTARPPVLPLRRARCEIHHQVGRVRQHLGGEPHAERARLPPVPVRVQALRPREQYVPRVLGRLDVGEHLLLLLRFARFGALLLRLGGTGGGMVVMVVVVVPLAAADDIDGSGSPDGPGSAALVDASSTVPSLEPCRLALLCLLLLLVAVVAVVTSAGAFTDPSGSCVCCSSTIFSTSYSLMLPEIS